MTYREQRCGVARSPVVPRARNHRGDTWCPACHGPTAEFRGRSDRCGVMTCAGADQDLATPRGASWRSLAKCSENAMHHLMGRCMCAIEFFVHHGIPILLQPLRNTLAACHWENFVMSSMRNKDGGLSLWICRHKKAGREGHDVAEAIAILQADGQRIGCAIGKASQPNTVPVDRPVAERPVNCVVKVGNVRSIAPIKNVPGRRSGLGNDGVGTVFSGPIQYAVNQPPVFASEPVEHAHQRSRPSR